MMFANRVILSAVATIKGQKAQFGQASCNTACAPQDYIHYNGKSSLNMSNQIYKKKIWYGSCKSDSQRVKQIFFISFFETQNAGNIKIICCYGRQNTRFSIDRIRFIISRGNIFLTVQLVSAFAQRGTMQKKMTLDGAT